MTTEPPPFARTTRGSGPGLVLAHGAGGTVETNFGPILDHLAAAHTVVGVDYPGAGDTPRSDTPLVADDLADQLVAAATAEGLDTFAVAGFSLGGPVAIRAATRHPDRVTALVLTATFAHANARLRLAAAVWRQLHEAGDKLLLAKYLSLATFSTSFLESLPPEFLDAALQEFARTVPEGTPEHTDLVQRIDVRDDLAAVRVPTLVISTTQDPLVTPDLHRRLATDIPGARLVEVDSGHLPFAECPEEWHRLITDFVAEHQKV
ncbi:alpha/beta fold hydrolase [Actinomadura sp. DC4]|uniref:alpha/beta fold hydrolase n=1 Tax=Actinomadura sp. DC4 TaxID=3055069 RepID=UPI00339D960F